MHPVQYAAIGIFAAACIAAIVIAIELNRRKGPVTVTLRADVAPFQEQMRRVAAVIDSGAPLWTVDPKLREVHVAGLETKMYVRAGMDHQVATPAALDKLVAQISHEPCLTHAEKGQVIAAAYRGWVTHRDGPVPETLAYHTLIGDTAIEFVR